MGSRQALSSLLPKTQSLCQPGQGQQTRLFCRSSWSQDTIFNFLPHFLFTLHVNLLRFSGSSECAGYLESLAFPTPPLGAAEKMLSCLSTLMKLHNTIIKTWPMSYRIPVRGSQLMRLGISSPSCTAMLSHNSSSQSISGQQAQRRAPERLWSEPGKTGVLLVNILFYGVLPSGSLNSDCYLTDSLNKWNLF